MQSHATAEILRTLAGTRAVLGEVTEVRGADARLSLLRSATEGDIREATVGNFVAIDTGRSLTIAVITEVGRETDPETVGRGMTVSAMVDLVGQIFVDSGGEARFQRGVTVYPTLGDAVMEIAETHAQIVYGDGDGDRMMIGHTQQALGLDAYVDIDGMLQKHFALFGTTGVGKSSGVAVILREVMDARPDLRIFLIDAHNEYGRCFGSRSQTLNPANLRLPFWMFNLEEIVDVFYRGRPGPDDEIDILSDVIPIAKRMYGRSREDAIQSDPGYTVDTPVPYRLADLIALIDDRMGKLENRSSRMTHKKLLHRITTVINDPRYAFMFEAANVGGDTMATVISQLFRLPIDGRPMTIMQLAGFPAEVVDSVVSVLCRLAFDFGLWSDGTLPLLVVCEEAHRYASANRDLGFGPTRRAISRIAKEGRKYGVFLGLVSQRPAELDATIISQCSTLFVMRLANDRDQAIIRSAVSDAAASLLSFVPSLGTREVLAFGEGLPLPTRLQFKELPAAALPRSEAVADAKTDFGSHVSEDYINDVIHRWRGAMVNNRVFMGGESDTPVAPRRPLDPKRYTILKKSGGE